MDNLPAPPLPAPALTEVELPETPRTVLKRRKQRGNRERAAIYAILDEALICHVGVNVDGAPRVLPTAHVRLGDAVYLHGSPSNRLLRALAQGAPCCLTVTLLDGLVFSRSAAQHSMNYRSAVLYGQATAVVDLEEKRAALHALVEHVAAGRSAEARPPSGDELRGSLVVRLAITEGSAKARSGPPNDPRSGPPNDLGPDGQPRGLANEQREPCWAGELPLRLCALAPVPDPQLPADHPAEGAVLARARSLGLSVRAPYERSAGEYFISTDFARVDFALVHRFLSEESYWARGVSEAVLRRTYEHALCFGLYRGREQLGFARVVTDYARFAYLGDVFVVKGARGHGLGKLLIEHVLAHPELSRVERFMLGTADAHGLYARYGFQPVTPERFMARDQPRP